MLISAYTNYSARNFEIWINIRGQKLPTSDECVEMFACCTGRSGKSDVGWWSWPEPRSHTPNTFPPCRVNQTCGLFLPRVLRSEMGNGLMSASTCCGVQRGLIGSLQCSTRGRGSLSSVEERGIRQPHTETDSNEAEKGSGRSAGIRGSSGPVPGRIWAGLCD